MRKHADVPLALRTVQSLLVSSCGPRQSAGSPTSVEDDVAVNVHLQTKHLHRFDCSSYWFQVSVCISLAVHVGHRRHNLSKKHPGLLL